MDLKAEHQSQRENSDGEDSQYYQTKKPSLNEMAFAS
jgi:hypothetical protein